MFARIVIALLLTAILVFGFQPILHPGFLGFWVTLGLIGLVFLIPTDEEAVGRNLVIGLAGAALFFAVAAVSTWSLFHAEAYRDQIGVETDGDFNRQLPPIDIRQAPLVSEDMARRSAEKQLADVPALGSQVTVGAFQKQLINGKLYWVAFLQHRSFFKWASSRTTPGYVRVSAVDATDVALVTAVGGQPLAMRYLSSGWFADDVRTHLYFNGYASRGVAAMTPEVDETGRPFYVVTFYRNTVGLGGAEASAMATVDVQTGAIQEYTLANAPAWADIIQPADLIETQVARHGELVHGWWNPGDKDKLRVSGEADLVYGADQRAYWYVGLTSSGNDNGLVGFYLIDSRTKAVHRFALSGVTEGGAQKAAEGVIPEKHYDATNPLPFVVAGRPTYVFALRDGSGIARAFAMVNIQTFQTLAVGETLPATLRQYEAALSRDPTANAGLATAVTTQVKSGAIGRIAPVVRQGNTFYTLTVEGVPARVLVASADLSDALPLARPGDVVTVVYEESAVSTPVVNLTGFTDTAVLPATAEPH
jgi:hypothetical protein